MPPTAFPLTPAPSTDIKGQEPGPLPSIDTHFQLPPAAVSHHDGSKHAMPPSPESPNASGPGVSSEPMSSNSALPPPPTRARKFQHVHPKTTEKEEDAAYEPACKPTKPKAKDSSRGKSGTQGTSAGRKVARKTAHSIIERRRRSKMNEEFGVLKDLIPACRGVEMHKLAILQASIDYMRYLETCVTDLKAGRAQSADITVFQDKGSDRYERDSHGDVAGAEPDSDDEMELDADKPSQLQPTEPTRSDAAALSATAAAALSPVRHHEQRHSFSSATSTTLPSPYFGPTTSVSSQSTAYSHSRSHSTIASPAFGPYYGHKTDATHQPSTARTPFHRYSTSSGQSRLQSTQTSPVIVPNDQGLPEAEASTALLMLNKDRRHSNVSGAQAEAHIGKRGMSVKDLLGS